VQKVQAGTQLVDAAGRTMVEIVGAVKDVSELLAEIAAATQEQSSGIGQVNAAVTQMDRVVQQNATLVEEAAAATESMKEQATALLELVSRFNVDANPAAKEGAAPVPQAARSVAPVPIALKKPQPRVAASAPQLRATPEAASNGAWKEF